MQLITPVSLPPVTPHLLSGKDRLLCLGSCFAQEVGDRLLHQWPEGRVVVNPLGPLYSPHSISAILRTWLRGGGAPEPFEGRDGLWHYWQASSVCSATQREVAEHKMHERWSLGIDMMRQCSTMIVTFGTTRYYKLTDESNLVVSNCHKELASAFVECEPDLATLIADWTCLLEELLQSHPDMQVILTVSPYRYRKYGFHASQTQKAKLLLLCDELQKVFENRVFYFPAYEILLDELRDYRFYAADMLHPSELAVDIIAERFREWCLEPSYIAEADERLKSYRKDLHRPLISS